MRNNPFAPLCSGRLLRPALFALSLLLAASSVARPTTQSQTPGANSASWRELVGTYKEPTTGRSARILDKGGELFCQTADGLTVVEFRLVQALSGDVFQTVETNNHQELSFFRDQAGNIAGLKFLGKTYLRELSADSQAASSENAGSGVPGAFPGARPLRIPQDLRGKVGDFADQGGKDIFVILERTRRLYLHDSAGTEHLLKLLRTAPAGDLTSSTFATDEPDPAWVLAFKQRGVDPIWDIFTAKGLYHRLTYSVPTGSTSVNLVKPLASIRQIRAAALAATPPEEKGTFRRNDLVELTNLDPGIRLDIRYATSNDFLGTPVYTQARAFLQRPAAEAMLRALRRLQPLGYGLLIHDGYRPWYVTKIFWDATPESGKIFVADPAQGSRHNRGCAVDLSLYDLKTNEVVEMTSLYDEMSPRAFPDYTGGTSLQRWHRDLLRWAMEAEGFTVYESEWWHFDYKDWREYAIGNIPFEKLNIPQN